MAPGIASDKYKDSLITLKEWLSKQSHLPQNIGKLINLFQIFSY